MRIEWQEIATAPKDGTVIRLKCEPEPRFGEHAMYWDTKKRRWAGMAFGVMRSVPTWWDEAAPQPTHWLPLALGDQE